MSRKAILQPYLTISSGNMASTITSSTTTITGLDKVQIELEWSGTGCNGQIYVDVNSVLNPMSALKETVWKTLDFGSSILINTNSGTHLILIIEDLFNQIRIRYVPSSGTGVLNAVISGKVVGQ